MTLRINHYPKYAAVVDIPEGGCRTLCGKPRSSSLEYVLGGIGPNFPVPAIPLEVDWYPDPLIIIQGTMPVSDADLKEERYWVGVWRSDGRLDWL